MNDKLNRYTKPKSLDIKALVKLATQQITKADRNAYHALCRTERTEHSEFTNEMSNRAHESPQATNNGKSRTTGQHGRIRLNRCVMNSNWGLNNRYFLKLYAKREQEIQSGTDSSGSRISSRDLLCIVLASAMGLFAGWLDMHDTEVAVTILALMIFGLLLGLIQPSTPWRWAVLIAIGLPIMTLAAIKFDFRSAEPVKFDFRGTLVALVFASMGAYIGAFIRHIKRNLTNH